VVFTPESFCPIDSTVTVNVIPGVGISADNVPPSLCAGTEEFQFNTDAPGGTWTATCAGCLSTDGLLDLSAAGIGDLAVTYGVSDGLCSDTGNWVVEVLPVLAGSVETVPDLCEGSVFNFDFLLDADIPEEYATDIAGTWSSTACPGCVTNANSGVFAADQVGAIDLVFTFNAACSEPITATVNVGAEEDPVTLVAADGGGVWSSSCPTCLTGNVFDPGAVDLDITLGTYTVTYVIDDICDDSDQITIEVMPQLDASIILTEEICIAAETVEAGAYVQNGIWTADCVGCIDQDGVIDLQAAGMGMLEVTYTLPGLCGDEQSALLAIEPCDIEVFNVMTPNEDGMNDALVFSNLDGFPGNELVVYDRWGTEVLRQTNYNNGWTGDNQAPGTYFYILTIPGLGIVQGTFTLLR
jgi:gliding motility-associated-like protein